jgi:hypothetical protein
MRDARAEVDFTAMPTTTTATATTTVLIITVAIHEGNAFVPNSQKGSNCFLPT